MFRITFFGTGNGMGDAQRESTFFLVQHERTNTTILVDVGGAPWSQLARVGVKADQLTALLLTHAHPDHIYGLPALIQSLWLAGRQTPLPVYCPQGAGATVTGLLDLFGLRHKPGIFAIEIQEQPLHGVTPLFTRDGITMQTFAARHGVPTMGFVCEAQRSGVAKRIVYSADSEYNPELEVLAKHARCLIHECNAAQKAQGKHSSLLDVLDLMKKAAPQQVVLVHLTEGEDYQRVLHEHSLGVPQVIVASDSMTLMIE
ncbi:MBL fold metallo-hydrolase [Heliophilum fasciatum]|uniref:Ribonuclease Z n=1 Tax=Heliophilum fasciatum TaxID=35700 RepID=A0A4R2RSJ7_9FIRM|nr:ribonuclease Z [Heliophilum fasciatum]MCW2277384.1 ribonuclease Z [Heliophilum fasciatum]TCP67220.1 ribonuclease Z [Heliophilum fasciatum]